MGLIGALTTFSAGITIKSADVNANFTAIRDRFNADAVLTDTAKTITVTHTFSASQTFSAGLTVSAGGIAVTGASTITGTLSGVTTFTATTLAGTLSTAAQPNVTSLGTLTALTVSGIVTLTAAASTLVPGATSFAIRNNANTANNMLLADGGAATFRSTITMAGRLTGTNEIALATGTVWLSNPGGTVVLVGNNDATLSVALGRTDLLTTATNGHAQMPAMAGVATGVPAVGTAAFIYDLTNNKIGVYNGTWKWTAALT